MNKNKRKAISEADEHNKLSCKLVRNNELFLEGYGGF